MFNWDEKDQYHLLIDVLRDDEVVLAASDTVLGLFTQVSEKAKKKLDVVKQRNLKPYIVLIKSAKMLDQFIDQQLDASMLKFIDQNWPGPVTIIFKAKSTLPDWMISSNITIAIRVPDHDGLQNLLESVDALFTTSANISDQAVPHSYAQLNLKVLDQVKIVCCQQDKIYDRPASTILDFSSGSIKIVRLGAVVIDSI